MKRTQLYNDDARPDSLERGRLVRAIRFLLLACFLVAAAFAGGCKTFILPGEIPSSLTSSDGLDVQLGLAQRAERSGELISARKAYREILQAEPDNAVALHRLGVVLVRLDELPDAIETMKKASELESPSSELLGDLGYAYLLHGDLAAAKQTLERALTLDPTDKRIINNQALVVGFLGNEEESLALFRRAGSEADALSNMGFVHAQLGEISKAKEYYLRALDLEPDMKHAAQALVDLHEAETKSRN